MRMVGGVVFGKRPLDIGVLVETVPVEFFQAPLLGDMLDVEPLHEQVFFLDDDGILGNIGNFGGNGGSIGSDDGFPGNIEFYNFGPVHHDQDIF